MGFYEGQETQEHLQLCGPHGRASMCPLTLRCRGDQGTIPLVLLLGTLDVPAAGTCCDWDQWEERAMGRPRTFSDGWGEPHTGNCEPKVEVMCKEVLTLLSIKFNLQYNELSKI